MRLAALLLLAISALAQERAVFKARVSLVHIDAEVAAEDGRILTGFTKDDFRVLDEGKPQPILHFSAGDEALDIILLFDISGSMKPKVQEVAAAARQGVRELRQGDRVAVMVFNTRTQLITPFTENLDEVERSIRQEVVGIPFGGGTFIQTAVCDAARRLMREPRSERRRAILIITDNNGQRTHRESTVVRDLWEADALLTGLIVRSNAVQTLQTINTIMHPYMLGLQVGVKGIAEKTGGDFIHSDDPGASFQESMRRIRSRYSLYYAMPDVKPGTRRAVKVELTADAAKRYPKAKVRSRTGYLAPAKD